MLIADRAEALTPPTFSSSAGGVSSRTAGSISDTEAFCTTGPTCGGYSASADSSSLNGGSVHATVTLSGVPLIPSIQNEFSASATADVFYGIMLGGVPGVTVPVYVSSYISALPASGYLSDQASLTVTSRIGGVPYSKTCYDGACSDSAPPFTSGPVSNGGSSGPAYLVSGQEYIVQLLASATGEYNGTVDAYVDPTFTVDSAFAGQFPFFGVPGVVTSGAPEPASWLMMLAGFGAVGFVLRAKKRTAASLA